MENKNTNTLFISIITLGVGLLIGCLIWNNGTMDRDEVSSGMHMMPDGMMMGNDSMTSMMNDMTASLKGKNGDSFDKAFIDEMIVHHEGAVAMAQLALTNAKHQEIKDMANAIISAQTKEIEQMKQWRASWYNR